MKQYLKSEIHPILPLISTLSIIFFKNWKENTRLFLSIPFTSDLRIPRSSETISKPRGFISRSGKNVHPFAFHPSFFFFPKVVVFLPARPSTRPFRSLKPSAVCKWQKRGQPALGLSRARCFTCTLLLNVAVVISIIISVTRGCSAN